MALMLMGGVLPAIFLIGIGQAFRPDPDQPNRSASWTAYLLASLMLLLAAIMIFYHLGNQASVIVLVLLPAALGALAQTLLWLAQSRLADVIHSKRLLAALLATLILLAALIPLTDGFIGSIILFGSLLLILAWLSWERLGRAWGGIYLLVLLLGMAAGLRIDTPREILPGIPWLARLSGLLPYLFIMLEMVILFRLLAWALQGENLPDWPRLGLAGLLALPILGLAGWQIATAAAWDVATDGLGGIAILQMTGVAGIAAATLAAWRQPANRRTPFFVLGLVLPLYMMLWMNFGTFGLDGPWGRVPIARTERRAAAIERAIQRYHERHNAYPVSLNELTPGYLLYLPAPFIIPGQDWCYQGGANYYRLGFVTRDYFSTPASVRIFASDGQPPSPDWPCEAEAARYPGPPELTDSP